jgi:exodeoxyribonuclease V alpha subunit
VLLAIPEGSEHFGRKLLYTAATRARGHLQVCGSDETLRRMMQYDSTRMSGLIDRVKHSQYF